MSNEFSGYGSESLKAQAFREGVFAGLVTESESWRWLAEYQADHGKPVFLVEDFSIRTGNKTYLREPFLSQGNERLRILDAMTDKILKERAFERQYAA